MKNPGQFLSELKSAGLLRVLRNVDCLPGGMARILVDGISRITLRGFSKKKDYLEVAGLRVEEFGTSTIEDEAYRRIMLNRFTEWVESLKNRDDVAQKAQSITNPGILADFIASQLPLQLVARQQLLEVAKLLFFAVLLKK